jgi:hypothetical protein
MSNIYEPQIIWWRRRESNPGPMDARETYLQAYPFFCSRFRVAERRGYSEASSGKFLVGKPLNTISPRVLSDRRLQDSERHKSYKRAAFLLGSHCVSVRTSSFPAGLTRPQALDLQGFPCFSIVEPIRPQTLYEVLIILLSDLPQMSSQISSTFSRKPKTYINQSGLLPYGVKTDNQFISNRKSRLPNINNSDQSCPQKGKRCEKQTIRDYMNNGKYNSP